MSKNKSLLTMLTEQLDKKPSKPKAPKQQLMDESNPFYIAKSDIAGKGAFASQYIPKGSMVDMLHQINQPGQDYDFTQLGRNYNHSDAPNTKNKLVGNKRFMVATEDIMPGQELTGDYRMQPDLEQPQPNWNTQEDYPKMANGGYTVTRSSDRKGKTHKVTGPGGKVKYFGDSSMGQHPKDPERKAAFYARHKKNLDGNPFFRAFARATWKDGGQTLGGGLLAKSVNCKSCGHSWKSTDGGEDPLTCHNCGYVNDHMQQGGQTNYWMTDRSKWVDSVNAANMDKNFVQRMYQKNGPQMYLPGDKRPSTHFMESGDGRAYPTVVQRPGNKFVEWMNQNNPDGAMNYALDNGQYIQFPNDEQATWYGQNGYKTGKGVVIGKKDGGSTYSGNQWFQQGGEAAARRARINAANKAQANQFRSAEDFAKSTSAIADKLRFSDEPNWFDDSALNPISYFGNMASDLGRVPLNIKKGNYGQAARDIATPVAAGYGERIASGIANIAWDYIPQSRAKDLATAAYHYIGDTRKINQIKKAHKKAPQYFKNPEVVKRLNEQNIQANMLELPSMTFKRTPTEIGSHYNHRLNNVEIDLPQMREMKRLGYDQSALGTYDHEMGHWLQRELGETYNRTDQMNILMDTGEIYQPSSQVVRTPIDAELSTMTSSGNNTFYHPKANPKLAKGNQDYFLYGLGDRISQSNEPFAFLREMRTDMLKKGYLDNVLDTPAKTTIWDYMQDNPKNRIASFMGADPAAPAKLAELMGKLPSAAPVVGAGVAASQLMDQKKNGGGWLDNYQDGGDIEGQAMDGVKSFLSGIGEVLSVPAKSAMYLATGKYQDPSEALGIRNPLGATLVDLVADPMNLAGGIGLLAKAGKAGKVLKTASKVGRAAEVVNGVTNRTDLRKWEFTAPKNIPIDPKDYRRASQASIDALTQRGKQLDNATGGKLNLTADDINYHGTYGGRPIVEVKTPNGSEYFYKSTGWGGKDVGQGTWQVYGQHMDAPGVADNWFVKGQDYKNWYGSQVFKNTADQMDNLIMQKYGVPQQDVNRLLNFQNIQGNVDTFVPKRQEGGEATEEDTPVEYTGSSIVDYLQTKGFSGSKKFRKQLAEEMGVEGYNYSAKKNLELLNRLREEEELPEGYQPEFTPVPVDKIVQMERDRGVYAPMPEQAAPQPRVVSAPVSNKFRIPMAGAPANPYAGMFDPRVALNNIPVSKAKPAAPAAKKPVASAPVNHYGIPMAPQQIPGLWNQQAAMERIKNYVPVPQPKRAAAAPVRKAAVKPVTKAKVAAQETEDESIFSGMFSGYNPTGMGPIMGSTMSPAAYEAVADDIQGLWDKASSWFERNTAMGDGTKERKASIDPKKIANDPIYVTGDTIPDKNGRYHIPEVMDLNYLKFGTRNRGDYTPIDTEAGSITAFKPFESAKDYFAKNNDPANSTYMGVGPDGKIKVGGRKDFEGQDFKISKTFSNKIVDFNRNPDGSIVKVKSNPKASKETFSPSVKVMGEDGKIVDGKMSLLLPKSGNQEESFDLVTGGRYIMQTPDGKFKMVSGSLKNIEAEFKKMKKDNPYVNVITLDNGSYSRGIRTYDKNLSAKDLKKYDNQNTEGGNFAYLLPNAPKTRYDLKFNEFETTAKQRLQQLYPGKKVEVKFENEGLYDERGSRDITSQAAIQKKGYSQTPVSMHNFDAARDYALFVDGKKIPADKQKDIYKKVLWGAADKVGMYHLDDWDAVHIGLVKEGEKTGFNELYAKYPDIFATANTKKTKAFLEKNKNNPVYKEAYELLNNIKPFVPKTPKKQDGGNWLEKYN